VTEALGMTRFDVLGWSMGRRWLPNGPPTGLKRDSEAADGLGRGVHDGALPRDGRYLLPLKDVVRKSAGSELDQVLTVGLGVGRQQALTLRVKARRVWPPRVRCPRPRDAGCCPQRRKVSG